MSNSLSMKRAAPIFPELDKPTGAISCIRWPRPRKRCRVASGCPELSSDVWLELASILNDDDFESQALSPSLENATEKECNPTMIGEALLSAFSEMNRACNEDDVLRFPKTSSSPRPPPPSTSSGNLSLISLDDSDICGVSPTDTSHEKVPTSTANDSETKEGDSEAELLTLTSFPFRIFSADDNFFRLTGLTSSRVIGEPLLTVFSTTEKSQLYPHNVHSPMDVFEQHGTPVTISNDAMATSVTSTRTMKIEPVWENFEGQKTEQVSHYKVTLE